MNRDEPDMDDDDREIREEVKRQRQDNKLRTQMILIAVVMTIAAVLGFLMAGH